MGIFGMSFFTYVLHLVVCPRELSFQTHLAFYFRYYSGVGTFITVPECETFQFRGDWAENLGAFGCTIGWAVARWLYVVAVMGSYGILYFVLAGLGNGAETKNPIIPFLGAIASGAFSFIPPFFPKLRRDNQTIDLFLVISTSVFGALVTLLNLWISFKLTFIWMKRAHNRIDYWLTSSTARKETMLKKAGLRKTAYRGSCAWRLLLVSMLMPWLSKYRRMTRNKSSTEDFDVSTLEFRQLRESILPKAKANGAVINERKIIEELEEQNLMLVEQLILSQASRQEEMRRMSMYEA